MIQFVELGKNQSVCFMEDFGISSRSRDVKQMLRFIFFYRNLKMSSISKCQNISCGFVIVHSC